MISFLRSTTDALSRLPISSLNKASLPRVATFVTPPISKVNLDHRRIPFRTVPPQKGKTTTMKTMKIGGLFLLGALLLSPFTLSASEKLEPAPLIETLNACVLKTIEEADAIPGLKSEEFTPLKKEISDTWNTLVQKGVVEIEGTDRDVRPPFVALQAIVEHVLSCALKKEIRSLKGMIHTPMPATPLCSRGEVSKNLVDPSIENDPKRLLTVQARTTLIRNFLKLGGVLYISYPKDGMSKRTEEQQTIYKEELSNYPDNLFNRPLNCSSIPDELVGATYLFRDQAGYTFAFSIQMTQAKDPKETGHFGLWLGSVQNAAVSQRVNAVFSFALQNGVDAFELLF
jgi:hypothetical protein